MKLVMGADFDDEKNNSGVLVNEAAVKALGLKEIIGEQTAFGPVVGVVKDFNMYSIHEAITPMLIGLNPTMCREIAIKMRTENMPETIEFLKQTWKSTGGTTAFDFDFTNDILNQIYESDIRFSKTIGLLAVIAILIASLGFVWLITPDQQAKNQRNRHPESDRRTHWRNCTFPQPRLCDLGKPGICDFNAHCLVCHAPLARKFCLQNHAKLVDFCFSWNSGPGNCATHR